MAAGKIAKGIALVNAGLALISFLYISSLGSSSVPVLVYGFLAPAVPIASAWIGLKLAPSPLSQGLLATGLGIGLVIFAATFAAVITSTEPLAPLLFILVALWQAAGMAVLLLAVWIAGRSRAQESE